MDSGIGRFVMNMIMTIIVIVIVIISTITWVIDYYFHETDSIKSKTLIVPTMKFEVNDNKIDTTYVYQLKE